MCARSYSWVAALFVIVFVEHKDNVAYEVRVGLYEIDVVTGMYIDLSVR